MPLRNGSLICDICWTTLFKFENFQQAWAVRDLDKSDLSRGYRYLTQTWKEIDDGENAGCNWCDYLWGDILEYRKKRRDQSLRTEEWPEDGEQWWITVRFTKNSTLDFYIGEDFFPCGYEILADHGMGLRLRTMILLQVSSLGERLSGKSPLQKSFALAKECLENCSMNHDCQTVEIPQLPTRVVDCSDPENPKLIPGAAINAHYAALSYVWGQAQPHSTSSATIQPYMLRIDISILPQTIVDAIFTAHSLGIRYLWTDTLCIIQDSPEDKNREISRMCDIYQKAFVTIIASCAKKAGDGFLHDRKRLVSMSLPFWTPSGALGTIQVQDQERSPQNEPVDKRAWCFQERLLASRALIYASHTMQFQCRQGIKNVGGEHNFWTVEGRDDLRIPINKIGERKAWRVWKTILAEYSRRFITSPADKLVALSGVAQAFQGCWDEDTDYIGGLWRNTLTQDLLWHRSGASTRVARPITYRAPSWSWAATDGPTDGGGWPGPTESLITIRKCQVTPRISDLAFGEIRGGTLEIEAVVRSVSWGSASLDSNDVPLFELCDGKNKEIGFVYHDCNDPSEQREGYAVVLAELNKAVLHHLVGIIVIPVIGMGDTYIRVGFFDVHAQIVDESYADEPFCDVESWLKTVKKHITVV